MQFATIFAVDLLVKYTKKKVSPVNVYNFVLLLLTIRQVVTPIIRQCNHAPIIFIFLFN